MMKKTQALLWAFVLLPCLFLAQSKTTRNGEKAGSTGHCAADQLHTALTNESTSYKRKFEQMNTDWQKWAMENNPSGKIGGGGSGNSTMTYTTTTLPVIFHMLTNTVTTSLNPNASTTDANLSKTQIQTALNILNQIFAGTSIGSKPAGYNTNIQFCLAEVDNFGNAITSYTYAHTQYSLTLSNSSQPQITSWSNVVQNTGKFPTNKYINIYVVEDIASPVAGFAYMPPAHGSSFDGIYIEAQYLLAPTSGPNDLAYNMTVLSHEMGHYLGLFHTFGICNAPLFYACSCDNNNCLFNGDMVCDTPPDFSQSPTVGGCSTGTNTCPTDIATIGDALNLTADVNDLTDNYMDYGDWNCQYLFTAGQVKRMQFMIDPFVGPRNSLLNSSVCNTVCANSACTVAVNPITTTSVNSIQLLNSLILSGPSVSHVFSATTCNSFYDTFNWSVVNLTTNSVIATGSGLTYNATFTATGNYAILLTSSLAGSTPLCSQTGSLSIQVLPPASCPSNLDMSAGWNAGNWERIYYEGGWSHTTNNSATFTHPTTTLTIHPGTFPNGTTSSDPFSITNTLAGDPNFSALSLPPGITNIMRVGRIITPTTTLPAGDGNYVTYTFQPTAQNARLRIYYLGMKEQDIGTSVYWSQFASNSGARTGFGWVCSYNFTNISSGSSTRGMTHTGTNGSLFPQNDMVSDNVNWPSGITSPTVIGGATFDRMNAWQFKDLDFTDFVCGAPTITITLYSRADEASTAGILHSYAYYGVTCLPAIQKDINLNLHNIDIPCAANVGASCTNIVLPPPNPYTNINNGYTYFDFFDVDVAESNDGITYTNTAISYVNQYNVTTQQYDPMITLCKSADANPFKYFSITYKTLCQTITQTLTIFQGFVHTIDDCAPDPMSGGHFSATPIPIGTQTISPDRFQQHCNGTTLGLDRPCWLATSDPDPDYQWQVGPVWSNIVTATNSTYFVNNASDICRPYRRLAKYSDPYCGTDIWIPSDEFSVSSIKANQFTYSVSGPDICGNSLATFSINNIYETNSVYTCDAEMAAMTATAPVTNTLSIAFFTLATCAPSSSIAAFTGPDVLVYTYTNNIPWTNDIDATFTFDNNGIYTSNNFIWAQFTVVRSGCTSTFVVAVPIKIKPSAIAGTISVGSNICTNANYTITGNNTNPTGYFWEYSYNSSFVPTLTLTSATNHTALITPSTFTGYPVYVRRVAYGTVVCPNVAYSNTLTLNNTVSTLTISPSSPTICAGQSETLTAAPGFTSYVWNLPSGGTSTLNPLVVTSTVSGVYTVTGTFSTGCTSTGTVGITVNPSPTITIAASTPTICRGSCATFTAFGALSYTWTAPPSFSSTLNPVTVCPTVTTVYTVTGTNSFGCTSTRTVMLIVIPNPTINVSPASPTICSGASSTLTASGGTSYTWTIPPSGTTVTNNLVVSPTVTTVYTVASTNQNGCPGTRTVMVTVNPTPTAAITGNTLICGECGTFTASGGGTYLWSNGSTASSVCIGTSGVLSVTVTSANGCTAVASVTTSANTMPTIYASASQQTICVGQTTTLTAAGGSTYTWTAPGFTSYINPLPVSPTVTTTYTVWGSKGPCSNGTTITIYVNPTPTVSIFGNSFICNGCATLTATGGGTYLWSNGATTASACISTPGVAGVTVTSSNGCVVTKTLNVVIGTVPNINANVSPNPICPGSTATLTGSGGSSYTWTPPGVTGSSVVVSPTVTTTYTVVGVNGKSCPDNAVVTLTVLPAPDVNITGYTTGCAQFNNTLTATGGGTYLWNTGATTNTIAVSGNVTSVYSCTVTGTNGCTAAKTITITVNPSNTITIVGTTTVCSGKTTTLTASSGLSWQWNTGATTNSIVTGLAGVYTVTANLVGKCKSWYTVTVSVIPSPTANITGNTTICNNSTTLTATGGGTYLWNTGATTNTISVSTTGVYQVTVTAGNGCTAVKTVTVTPAWPCDYNAKTSGGSVPDPVSEPFVYPNPTHQSFSIGNAEGVEMVEVFDYTGKLIMQVSRSENRDLKNISIIGYDNGVYFVRVLSKDREFELFKLIKQ
jgi:hypothetical protein